MEVVILSNAGKLAERASSLVAEMIKVKPTAVLGLATGSTPLQMYQNLIQLYENGQLSFSEISSFNLDEYLGLDETHSQSYRSYMNENFFNKIDIDLSNTFLPTCESFEDPHAAGAVYEKKIVNQGGIDLQILGIGSNGHIGFNEPSSSLSSRTRIKTLARQTVLDNARLFNKDEFQPQLAITMGIGTIMDARRVLLLATGKQKSAAIAKMIEGDISASCPASALQMHESVTVLIDEDAAAGLAQHEYYRWVHDQNEKLTQVYGTRLSHEWNT